MFDPPSEVARIIVSDTGTVVDKALAPGPAALALQSNGDISRRRRVRRRRQPSFEHDVLWGSRLPSGLWRASTVSAPHLAHLLAEPPNEDLTISGIEDDGGERRNREPGDIRRDRAAIAEAVVPGCRWH
jgi:hypothetical protein